MFRTIHVRRGHKNMIGTVRVLIKTILLVGPGFFFFTTKKVTRVVRRFYRDKCT